MQHQIQWSISYTLGHFNIIQTRERPQRWLCYGGQTEEFTVLSIPHQNIGRAYNAGYPIGRFHSTGNFKVEVTYCANNLRSRDTKHELIVDFLARPVNKAFKHMSSLRLSSNSQFQKQYTLLATNFNPHKPCFETRFQSTTHCASPQAMNWLCTLCLLSWKDVKLITIQLSQSSTP